MTDEDFKELELTQESIKSMIYIVRGQRVMFDFDLARIYGYETKTFNIFWQKVPHINLMATSTGGDELLIINVYKNK